MSNDAFNLLFTQLLGGDRFNYLFDMKIDNYPPFNLFKSGDNTYVLEFGLAGFAEHEIEVEVVGETLTVKTVLQKQDKPNITYIHHGLAKRSFVKKFTLDKHMEVSSAKLKDGVLKIVLERQVPEKDQPRKLLITKE